MPGATNNPPKAPLRLQRTTEVGLVVSPRVKLTWSVPVRVPVEVDALGNVTRWIECDREIAGQWDDRVWRG